MKQPSKNRRTIKNTKKRITVKKPKVKPLYGTSKLEEDFARDFLDKLGVRYIYQYEAKGIGRFYDFAVILDENMTNGSILLIEIDGGFYHSDPRVVDESKLSPMQKRNKRVDEYKNKWALEHGIPLIRIWEKDIRESPKKVMDELKTRLHLEKDKVLINESKKKRHVNKIK